MSSSEQQPAVAASTAPVTSSSRRQSCDRCYGQKLRCTRQIGGATSFEDCSRCIKRGAQCFSLPKGRPPNGSMSAAALAHRDTPPLNPISHQRHPSKSRTTGSSKITATGRKNRVKAINNTNTASAASIETSAAVIDALSRPQFDYNDWDSLVVDPKELTSYHPNFRSHLISTLNVDAEPTRTNIEPLNNPDWDMMEFDGALGNARGSIDISSDNSSNTNTSDSNHRQIPRSERLNGGTNIEESPYEKIAQLSQLSTRLFTLYHSKATELSYAALNSRQTPLFDDDCYRIVAGWFVYLFARMQLQFPPDRGNPISGTRPVGEILHSIFSASHCLLDVLRILQKEHADSKTADGFSWTGSRRETEHPAQVDNEYLSAYFQQNDPSAGYQGPPSHCPNTVLRHLVIACHIQILNIYVTVLIALQHDAALKGLPLSTDGQVEDDTRLALVVKLCAYLLERQRQAVDSFVNQTPHPTVGTISSPMNNRAMTSHLEIDVQQRLTRVQQMLRI